MSKNATVPVALEGATVAVTEIREFGGVGLGVTARLVVDAVVDGVPMTMFEVPLSAVESREVATLNEVFGYVPTPGFVMPGTERVPEAEFPSEHPVPSATVATFPLTESVAPGQLPPKPVNTTVWPVAIEKFELRTTLIVSAGDSAPDPDVVRPTVQVESAFAAVEPGENTAFVGADAYAAPATKVAARPPVATNPASAAKTRRVRGRAVASPRFLVCRFGSIEFPFVSDSSLGTTHNLATRSQRTRVKC